MTYVRTSKKPQPGHTLDPMSKTLKDERPVAKGKLTNDQKKMLKNRINTLRGKIRYRYFEPDIEKAPRHVREAAKKIEQLQLVVLRWTDAESVVARRKSEELQNKLEKAETALYFYDPMDALRAVEELEAEVEATARK